MEEPLQWYGVRTVYEHEDRARGRERLYEERIVLVRAPSQDDAIAKAEREADAYGADGVRYLGYAICYEMPDAPGEGSEVFSLMRESRLESKRYLDVFFDTGRERTQEIP